MKLGTEIKKYFRGLGIPVRVRTVAVKNPFVQVWIESDNTGVYGPLKYSHEFPLELREKLLKVIYGPRWVSLPGREGNAGNVTPYSLIFFSESEWRATIDIN